MRPGWLRLFDRIGYRFAGPDLLQTALTHRSHGSPNNERLEFLGDAVLSVLVSESLYRKFPEADEGTLSRLRASVVNGDTLAGVAGRLQLGDELLLGPGEMKSGGFRRHSILAGALEALIGAVYLEGGFEAARGVVMTAFQPELERIALEDEYFIAKKLYPNVDFYSGIIFRALGIPTSMFTALFAMARTAGWVAQWHEMLSDPAHKIGRPRQLYIGSARREFVPIEQRKA